MFVIRSRVTGHRHIGYTTSLLSTRRQSHAQQGSIKSHSLAVHDGKVNARKLLHQEWVNSALKDICLSEMFSRAYVVDSVLFLLLRVTMLF